MDFKQELIACGVAEEIAAEIVTLMSAHHLTTMEDIAYMSDEHIDKLSTDLGVQISLRKVRGRLAYASVKAHGAVKPERQAGLGVVKAEPCDLVAGKS